MGHDPSSRQFGALTENVPINQWLNLEQYIPSALFARLNDVTLKAVEAIVSGMHHAPPSAQRHKPCNPQLGKLFQKERTAISLGQGGCHLELKAQFACRRFHGQYLEVDTLLFCRYDLRWIFMAVPIEKANSVAGAESANDGQVVSFRSLQQDRAGLQRRIDIKSFGHT
jgi:hypothetical protein